MAKKAKPATKQAQTAPYQHPEAKSLMRPEGGDAGAVQEEESPEDLPLRFIALARARLGRHESGPRAG